MWQTHFTLMLSPLKTFRCASKSKIHMGVHKEVHMYKMYAVPQTATLLDKIQVNFVIAKRRALHQKEQVETLIHCNQQLRAPSILQPVAHPHPPGTTIHTCGSRDELWYPREDGKWKRCEEGYLRTQENRLPL